MLRSIESRASRRVRRHMTVVGFAALSILGPGVAQAGCSAPVAVQVLGSGGPVSDDARASSGYLVWIDGEARLLIDAGGGVFLRFGEAKAKFETLDAIAITHLHADHVTDLAAILKSGFFSDRKRPLPIIGPTGSPAFPGMRTYMHALFDARHGAYRYLSGYLDGSGGLAKAEIAEISAKSEKPQKAFANAAFKLSAVGVMHGPVPALGYVVEVRGRKFAFSGDQGGDNPDFTAMIEGADILVMDHAVPEDAGLVEAALHDRPSEIGKLAKAANVKKLVLSHNMARSLNVLPKNLATIAEHYTGSTVVADDLMCFAPDGDARK
ncbi:MBL fold metallo-hydrolase [Methylobacterium sp. C25]|uniref:MBL fold metallo-hydrolase n=1 Tax=Methylobacterium sp. C25 TaxID=2721622 RepID=UPI001F231A11|nr:MBL fold metallo-hydrolase [Methylobacterium sp. C25]MCE4225231.1 MBL fold metallo-hydrolase [Methylobacterium sp. C25]